MLLRQRKLIRLAKYDYSGNGVYFVTICTQNRESCFGKIIDGRILLNNVGQMVDKQWQELKNRFFNIELDEYILMPNHIHGIIFIVGAPLVGARDVMVNIHDNDHNNCIRAGIKPAPTVNSTLGAMVGAFKSITTNEYINNVKNNNWSPFNGKLWQRNYYEHIIRDEKSLYKIREYIINNPSKWNFDRNNLGNLYM